MNVRRKHMQAADPFRRFAVKLLLAGGIFAVVACRTAGPQAFTDQDYASGRENVERLLAAGDPFGAERLLRDLQHRAGEWGTEDQRRQALALQYARLVLARDNWKEAEAIAHRLSGNAARSLVGQALERKGDLAGAIGLLRASDDLAWLCRAYVDSQQFNAAARTCSSLSTTTPDQAVASSMWLVGTSQNAAAEKLLRAAIAEYEPRAAAVREVSTLQSLLGRVLIAEGRPVEGEAALWQAYARQTRVLGGSLYLSDTVFALGVLRLANRHPASAQAHLFYALDLRRTLLPEADWRVQQAAGAMAACLHAERRSGDLVGNMAKAYDVVRAARGDRALETLQLSHWLNDPLPETPSEAF